MEFLVMVVGVAVALVVTIRTIITTAMISTKAATIEIIRTATS